MTNDSLKTLQGSDKVESWFGYCTFFHDAEISKLALHDDTTATFNVHAWNTTSELDDKGYFKQEKHADVTFRLENVSAIDIADITEIGIMFDLVIEPIESGFRLVISSSYGLNGTITFSSGSVELTPR